MRTRAGRAILSAAAARGARASPSDSATCTRPRCAGCSTSADACTGGGWYCSSRPGSGRSPWSPPAVGGAVQRNRARRILRAAWREVAPTAGDGNDVVLVAREAIRGAKTQDLVAEMTELLRREPLVRQMIRRSAGSPARPSAPPGDRADPRLSTPRCPAGSAASAASTPLLATTPRTRSGRAGRCAGTRMAVWRILRCNPFGGGGIDHVSAGLGMTTSHDSAESPGREV